jgi:hypothetical protein
MIGFIIHNNKYMYIYNYKLIILEFQILNILIYSSCNIIGLYNHVIIQHYAIQHIITISYEYDHMF